MTRTQRAKRRGGLSLVEVVVSSLLVGLVMVASLRSTGAVFRTWSVAADQAVGQAIVQHLMSEVIQARYEDPEETPVFGHEPAEAQSPTNRNDFDDVDDYHGWSVSTPEQKDGTPLSDYASWQRDVTIALVDPDDPTTVSGTDEGLKRITVTATSPQGQQTTLVALRSRLGMLEQAPSFDTTFVTGIGSSLKIGSDGIPVHTGTHVGNHASDQ